MIGEDVVNGREEVDSEGNEEGMKLRIGGNR